MSPDGRWIAYESNEEGDFEVYVRPFPNVDDGKRKVSTQGGSPPDTTAHLHMDTADDPWTTHELFEQDANPADDRQA